MSGEREQKVGSLLDSLGVTVELEETDMISDALVLLRISPEQGSSGVLIGASDNLDHIVALGMLTRALDVNRHMGMHDGEEDDG